MGRYYHTNSGREGKFMFGVQPSTDPEEMGMNEDPTYIQYYAGEEDKQKIKKKLDEQYDKLDIPLHERIYYMKDWGEYDKYEKEVLEDKVWVKVKDDSEEAKKYKDKAKWYCEDKGYTKYERKGMALILARIRLGLVILSDIEDEGYCSLKAET